MLALLAAASLALAAVEPVAITHVSVIEVATGRVQRDVTVRLEGGRISAIGRRAPVRDARVVEGTGKFLIPGLWDMHVHAWQGESTLSLFLANGVTGVRDMFGPLEGLTDWRKKIEGGMLLGPRLVFAGPIVDGPKPMWPGSIAVGTPEEGRKAVASLQQQGVDFVKVYSGLPREAYLAIAEEARRRQMVFAGHVPDGVGPAEASEAGQKSCEHLLGVLMGCSRRERELLEAQGMPMMERARRVLDSYDPAKARQLCGVLRQNRTWQCPTVVMLEALAHLDQPGFRHDPRLAYMPPPTASAWDATNSPVFGKFTSADWDCARATQAQRREVVRLMAKAGVGILAGTDTPNPGCFPGFSLHDELALLVACGLTPLQALQTATLNPARYLDRTKDSGTVQVGKEADLVLLNANPLERIQETTNIAAVFVRGRHLERAELDSLLQARAAEMREAKP